MKSIRILLFLGVPLLAVAMAGAESSGGGAGGSMGGGVGATTGSSNSTGASGDIGTGATGDTTPGVNEDAGGAGETNGAATGEGTTDDNSGIFTPDRDATDDILNRGDSAPRTEPPIREDRFNTSPRVPAEPADQGGGGATGADEDTGTGATDNGTGDTPGSIINDVPNDAGAAAPDDKTGDRNLTRELNGTAGSRPSMRQSVQ